MSLTVSNRTNTVQCPKPLLTLNLLNVKYSKIKKKIKPFHHTMSQDIFSLRKREMCKVPVPNSGRHLMLEHRPHLDTILHQPSSHHTFSHVPTPNLDILCSNTGHSQKNTQTISDKDSLMDQKTHQPSEIHVGCLLMDLLYTFSTSQHYPCSQELFFLWGCPVQP